MSTRENIRLIARAPLWRDANKRYFVTRYFGFLNKHSKTRTQFVLGPIAKETGLLPHCLGTCMVCLFVGD